MFIAAGAELGNTTPPTAEVGGAGAVAGAAAPWGPLKSGAATKRTAAVAHLFDNRHMMFRSATFYWRPASTHPCTGLAVAMMRSYGR